MNRTPLLDTTGLRPVHLLRARVPVLRVLAGVLATVAGAAAFRLLDHPDDTGTRVFALAVGALVVALMLLRQRFPAAILVAAEGVRRHRPDGRTRPVSVQR